MRKVPEIVWKNGRARFMTDEGEKRLLSGQLFNSSSSSENYMNPIWPRLRAMHLNSVIATASWELIEPEEGRFVFDSVDHLIFSAREYGLKIILIWFATWKNGMSTYVPEYVKIDRETCFRAVAENGQCVDAVSPFCEACCEKDARAFRALMRHIRAIDAEEQTVIMIQVENETGTYCARRDHSPAAEREWKAPLPAGLKEALDGDALMPELAAAWTGNTENWRAAFGDRADECFMAYGVARYVNRVAEAGKAEYGIPMYVNAWMAQYHGEPAELRPSGGPDPRVLPIWRFAAPALSGIGCDLYEENFVEECDNYTFGGKNPLMIPELRRDRWAPAEIVYALSRGAILVSPFGIDGLSNNAHNIVPAVVQSVHQTMSDHDPTEHIAAVYAEVGGMGDFLTDALDEGRVTGILQGNLIQDGLDIGPWHIRVTWPYPPQNLRYPGAVMVIAEDDDTFTILALSASLEFMTKTGRSEILSLEEGSFASGAWVGGRRLNGVELSLRFGEMPRVLRLKMHRFESEITDR